MDTNMQSIMQQAIEQLLRKTNREGIESLIDFLQKSGYYTAHCHNHHHFEGGTSQHGMEALLYALAHNPHHLPEDSLIVVCLLHDMCDIRGYRHHEGHGRRSCKIITQEAQFPLTEDKYLAILHHMHSATRHPERFGKDLDKVTNSPLWQLLRESDHYSAGHVMARYQLADKIKTL